jgi:hypothetical protein
MTAPEGVMTMVRLLGFATLDCGCLIGRYRELAQNREVDYVEEKGRKCERAAHRRNQLVAASPDERSMSVLASARAV